MYFDQRFLKSQSISGDLLGMNMVVQYCFLWLWPGNQNSVVLFLSHVVLTNHSQLKSFTSALVCVSVCARARVCVCVCVCARMCMCVCVCLLFFFCLLEIVFLRQDFVVTSSLVCVVCRNNSSVSEVSHSSHTTPPTIAVPGVQNSRWAFHPDINSFRHEWIHVSL
jgi:hypothetical protein